MAITTECKGKQGSALTKCKNKQDALKWFALGAHFMDWVPFETIYDKYQSGYETEIDKYISEVKRKK